jgi:hypothetical protein
VRSLDVETYRLYFMTADGLHIDRFEPIEARDDFDAVRFAEIYLGAQELELWLGSRKVQIFEGQAYRTSGERTRGDRVSLRDFAPGPDASGTASGVDDRKVVATQ